MKTYERIDGPNFRKHEFLRITFPYSSYSLQALVHLQQQSPFPPPNPKRIDQRGNVSKRSRIRRVTNSVYPSVHEPNVRELSNLPVNNRHLKN